MPVPGNSVQSDQAGVQRGIQLFRLWKVAFFESKKLWWWFLWFLLSKCLISSWHMDCFTRSVKREVLSQASKTMIVIIPALLSRATSSALPRPPSRTARRRSTRASTPREFSVQLRLWVGALWYGKWPLYCPQGSGTLRQQLLMMHGIAWFCMVLHCIA